MTTTTHQIILMTAANVERIERAVAACRAEGLTISSGVCRRDAIVGDAVVDALRDVQVSMDNGAGSRPQRTIRVAWIVAATDADLAAKARSVAKELRADCRERAAATRRQNRAERSRS